MKIKNIEIKNKFVLAPMAAVNCTAFRMLCKENNVGLIYTQMYDADLISEKTKNEVKDFLNIQDIERPVVVQLIGSNKEKIVRAAKLIEPFANIIDFNIGCALSDYLSKNCGGALLNDLNKLEDIVKSLVKSVQKPVTCKIRIGYDAQNINAVKVCQMLENCGVSAIAIHGRTIEQKYAKKVNWTIMKQVKEKLKIPLIANGDVKNYNEGLELLERTKCDFVMIGREAQHAPWIFNKDFVITNENIVKQILRFLELYQKYEKRYSQTEINQHVYWMFRDIKTKLRAQWIYECNSIEEIKTFLKRI